MIDHIEKLFSDCLRIIKSKNQDYATKENPLQNFSNAECAGVTRDQVIYARMADKMSRIGSYLAKGKLVVEDESVRDSLADLINLTAILDYSMSKPKEELIPRSEMEKVLEKCVDVVIDYFNNKGDTCGVNGCCGMMKGLTVGSDWQYSWTESECDVCHRRTKEVRNF